MGKDRELNQKIYQTAQKFISIAQAAKIFNYSRQHLLLLIRLKKLKGVKIGNFYFTTEEWVREYINFSSSAFPAFRQNFWQRDLSLPILKIVWSIFAVISVLSFFYSKPLETLAYFSDFSKPSRLFSEVEKIFSKAVNLTDRLATGYVVKVNDLLNIGLSITRPININEFGEILNENISTLIVNFVNNVRPIVKEILENVQSRVAINKEEIFSQKALSNIKSFFRLADFINSQQIKTPLSLDFPLNLIKIVSQNLNENRQELGKLQEKLLSLEAKVNNFSGTIGQETPKPNKNSLFYSGKISDFSSIGDINKRISNLELKVLSLNKTSDQSIFQELLDIKEHFQKLSYDLLQLKTLVEKFQERNRLIPLPIFGYQSAPVAVSSAANVLGYIGGVKNAFEDDSLIPAKIRVGEMILSGKNINSLSSISPDNNVLTLGGSFIPAANNVYNLGSDTNKWNTVYAQNLSVNSLSTNGQQIITYQPTSSNINESSLYINPTSADSTFSLLGLSVNNLEKFRVNANGDIITQGALTVVGSATSTFSGPLVQSGGQVSLATTTINGVLNAQSINIVGTSSLGIVNSGTWQGNTISINYGGTGVTALSDILGTANQITVTNGTGRVIGGNVTLSLPQDIHTGASPTFSGLNLSGLTIGSILFAGSGGAISQDNTNLFWDNTNKRLGIGTTSPGAHLEVIDHALFNRVSEWGTLATFRKSYTASNNEDLYINFEKQTTAGGPFTRYGYIQLGTGGFKIIPEQGTNLLLAPLGGNVGIGTTAPGYLLHVSRSTDGDVAGFTDANGTCTINPTNTALICSSDIRAKEVIGSLSGSLEKIMALNPIIYRWKNQTDNALRFGFGAQEVEEIIPELVLTASDGSKSLNYIGFTPFLVNAIQELSKQIEGLKLAISQNGNLIQDGVEVNLQVNNQSFLTLLLTYLKDAISQLTGTIKTAGNWLFERLSAKEIEAQKICLEDICITKEELRQLLEKSGIYPKGTSSSDLNGYSSENLSSQESEGNSNYQSQDDKNEETIVNNQNTNLPNTNNEQIDNSVQDSYNEQNTNSQNTSANEEMQETEENLQELKNSNAEGGG